MNVLMQQCTSVITAAIQHLKIIFKIVITQCTLTHILQTQNFMEPSMVNLIFTVLCLNIAVAQFAKQLRPISDCLNSCAYCDKNQLDVCLLDHDKICIAHYIWDQEKNICVIQPVYRNQIIFLSGNGQFTKTEKWQHFTQKQCYYLRANEQIQKIRVMGLFESSIKNSVKIDVSAYYQSMIVSFNLVRNSWAPYMDFMHIVIIDQEGRELDEYTIDYVQREYMTDEDLHTILCDQEVLLNQKFQFTVNFRHKNVTQVQLLFSGLLQGGELWGLTNFKVAFGCSNNLFYNDKNCLSCQPGFYLDLQHLVNNAPTCHQCTINCLSCDKNKCLTCASGMIAVNDHCQSSAGFKLMQKVYHPTQVHCGISMLHSYDEQKVHRQAIQSIPMATPEYHKSARLILDLYLTDTQWTNQSSLILQVDGKLIMRVHQHNIHNRLRQKCPEFAVGYFSHFKIVTPYFQHTLPTLSFRIYSADSAVTDFGIGDISLQIQIAQPPQIVKNESQAKPNPPIEPKLPEQKQKVPQKQDSPEVRQIKQVIKQIVEIKDQIVISHNTLHDNKKNGQLIININYPFEIKNYPYIYCRFEKAGMYLPGKMRSSTNHLQLVAVEISQSLVNQIVIITMSAYEKNVIKRNLQTQPIHHGQQIELGRIKIERYDVLDITEMNTLHSIQVFFITITWIFLILTIILMMIGKGSIITDLSNLIQLVYVHIYINGQFLTPTFKLPISGLRNMENLNYFSQESQSQIQNWLLGNVVQESPIRFTQFSTDINFSRGIYPIVIINVIFLIWFGCLILLNKILKKKVKLINSGSNQNQNPYSKQALSVSKLQYLSIFLSKIVDRPINYWYFVLKYQFMAVVWLCFLQFYNMSYPWGSDRNQTINAIFCIFSFICTLCWPVGIYLLIKHYYNTRQYMDYMHNFEDIFGFQLYQKSLPSNHHRYYILLGKLRLILYALCCSYLGNSPIQSLVILIIVNVLSIIYLQFARPILDKTYMRLYFVQYGLLILLEIVMIVAYIIEEIVGKNQYFLIGYFMVAISIALFLNALTRMIYKLYRIKTTKSESKSSFNGELATQRIV